RPRGLPGPGAMVGRTPTGPLSRSMRHGSPFRPRPCTDAASDQRDLPRRHHPAVPGGAAERHRVLPDLRDPVEQLRLLAARRRAGVRCAGGDRRAVRAVRPRPAARQHDALLRAGAGGLDRRLGQCLPPRPRCVGDDARRAVADPGGDGARLRRQVDRFLRHAHGRYAMKRLDILALAVATVLVGGCSGGDAPDLDQYGANPELPDPHRGFLPNMTIAEPAEWGDRRPTVPEGYTITPSATDLLIPRQTLVLPNGDILVAEGRGGNAPKLKPKDVIAGIIKAQGNTKVQSGNRLTLLRDADGDGTYELKTVFAENLNAPYGLALVGNALYVANQDALVRFDYSVGQTRAAGAPVKVTDLPSEINHHWTKSLAASADGSRLYVGIGSNSNAS